MSDELTTEDWLKIGEGMIALGKALGNPKHSRRFPVVEPNKPDPFHIDGAAAFEKLLAEED